MGSDKIKLKGSLSETFGKLKEIMAGGFWDDCICVCRGLMKDNPCDLKCKEFLNEELTNSHKEKNDRTIEY